MIRDESFTGRLGASGLAFRIEFGFFEVVENFSGAGDDRIRQSGEPRDLDAVALIGAAGEDFSEENNLVVPFPDGDIEI